VKTAWPLVRLGDVCELRYGKSLAAPARSGTGFGVYGSNGEVGRHTVALTEGPTIVIGRKGSFGEVHFSAEPCWPIDTTYFVDADATTADLRWLFHRMKALPLTQLNRAAAIPGLNREDAYAQSLLLPPVEEQRRIAAVLDTADALRAKRRQALARLDTLTQAIFIDMFGDPNSPACQIVRLGDLVRAPITRGVDQPGPEVVDGVPYIRTTDVTGGVTHRNRLSRCAPEVASQFQRSVVEFGDVVICIRATVGPTLLVGEDLVGANLSRGTARIAPSDDVRSEYLYAALNSEYFRRQVEGQLRGATFLQLPLGELRDLLLPLPSRAQQERFVEAWRAREVVQTRCATSLAQLDALFASLQHRAFRGEL